MKTLDDKKILVVGGAGFVGSNLCNKLLSRFELNKLYIVDNLLSSEIENLPNHSNVEFIYGSIADDKVLNQLPNDLSTVFHLACYHGNQASIVDPMADHDNNTVTSLKLFDRLCSFKDIEKVVYAAAGCAVAEKTFTEASATLEDAPVSLFHDSPYSISKLIGEMYGNYYWSRYGLPFVKARFQNVYGPREILGAGRWRGTPNTVWRNVIPTFIYKSLNGEALPLDNGGNASRDFIFVDDLVEGLILCALFGKSSEAYNLASGKETRILDLAEAINTITGNTTPLALQPARDWDNSGKRFGSTEKSTRDLGFSASMNLYEGLKLTIEWTKDNYELISKKIANHDIFMRRYEH